MRAQSAILTMCATALLMGGSGEVKSQEQSFDFLFDDLYGFLGELLSTPSTDVFCSTPLGASDIIEKSGGVLPDTYREEMVEIFNANSFYHCKVVELEEEPTLWFLKSYKDAQGVTWHIFYTHSLGPISYTWRLANIPYA